ncbi:hypothetical protein I9X38_07565 [Bacillus mojavensis]|nr:hypothetical protein I9X38_07565 [Bacillus mojavensis]
MAPQAGFEPATDRAPAEPPELVVSEARLREEQENEEEEAERSEPLALKSEDSEDIKAEEAPAEPPELVVSEARLREEQENEEEEAERRLPANRRSCADAPRLSLSGLHEL